MDERGTTRDFFIATARQTERGEVDRGIDRHEEGAVSDAQFLWDDLAKYKAEGRFLEGYPPDERTFFSPRDKVHDLLVASARSTRSS